ncbi:MAG TPA: 2-C-methyl-D-erythritol 2,4-cyclodiphosphate synthase [Fimbriimonadaceae bacterium]|nr:2-C-methyl-D-erythritol 2,4-cyclodiphosphate synthase [Fimbriimonadaceae bacterium]
MRVVALLPAAGRGERFGRDKLEMPLGGRPLWRWSYDLLASHPRIAHVVVIGERTGVPWVPGGATRQASVTQGLAHVGDADAVLIHDAARPFLTSTLIDRVLDALAEHPSVAAAVPVTDTIRATTEAGVTILDRSRLLAMQTPQAARVELLRRALAEAGEFTDDVGALEAIGIATHFVLGERRNFKITAEEDYWMATTLIDRATDAPRVLETRTGLGYDVHAFSTDLLRPLWLGGVRFEGTPGLLGHSDADVVAHAVVDAILGAAGLGDIGVHFANDDARWKDAPSALFLKEAATMVRTEGWALIHIDVSVLAEKPRIMVRRNEMCAAIAEALGIEANRISIKATTNEGLGAIGRGEGIAAFAVATLSR